MSDPIYLDYNATTPIDPHVRDVMIPFLDQHFGNPSSSHWYGVQTKKAVEKARSQVANALGCDADEIIFTSGGSESNNLAIKGYAMAHRQQGRHIITSAVEHPAVMNVCAYLKENGFRVTIVPVDEFGMVNPEDIEQAVDSDTVLITIMHANNEVGTIQPIEEISKIAKKHRIAFHTDAAQSVGKIPVQVNELGVDMLSLAGHKLYAPKGIGALYIRRGTQLEKLIHGADHERNLRAGTENVLEIVGLGAACELVSGHLHDINAHLKSMAGRLLTGMQNHLSNMRLNGHPEKRLPNTVNVSFYGIEANTILSELDNIAASAGAACHADDVNISTVLQAMGVPADWAMGTIRLSTGKFTTSEEVDRAVDEISAVVQRLSGESSPAAPSIGEEIKLTHFTHGLGCACKIQPQQLEVILQHMPKQQDPNVLVDTSAADDAAVYRLDDETAIVQTLDFFTPIVDDPYHFGAIAAANALSDIYAMGAGPLFALNIVAFPTNRLPMTVLNRILQGAAEKTAKAGIPIVGGHSVDDTEPKYGLVVTGRVHPEKIIKNHGAQPGDVLILTKPLGTGIISTAMKRGLAESQTMAAAIETMSTLNRQAAEIMLQYKVHACTDVTGFGLLGHLYEMINPGHVNAELNVDNIHFLPQARELAEADVIPGGSRANWKYVSSHVERDSSVSQVFCYLLADAQTSGGLLIASAEKDATSMLDELQKAGCDARTIGRVTGPGDGMMRLG